MLYDLANSVADMTTYRVSARAGRAWNEVADSLARRQAKRDEASPRPEWTAAFHADRRRLWSGSIMHQHTIDKRTHSCTTTDLNHPYPA